MISGSTAGNGLSARTTSRHQALDEDSATPTDAPVEGDGGGAPADRPFDGGAAAARFRFASRPMTTGTCRPAAEGG